MKHEIRKLFFILVTCLSLSATLFPQVFDYHQKESPAITWNGLMIFDTRMLSMGGVSFTASPEFAGAVNPALIPKDNTFRFGVSGGFVHFEAAQYWGINEGVVGTSRVSSGQKFVPGSVGIVFPGKTIRFALGAYTSNLLEFPSFKLSYTGGEYKGDFKGKEHTIYGAAAIRVNKNFDVGLKLEYIRGTRDVEINDIYIDSYYSSNVIVYQEEKHRSSLFVPSIGFAYRVSEAFRFGATLIYPLDGKVNRTLNRGFIYNNNVIAEIKDLKSEDTEYRPVKVVVGASLDLFNRVTEKGNARLLLGTEAVYTAWEKYKYEFYSELQPREMRNTVSLGMGLEYNTDQQTKGYSYRIGFRLDPQPLISTKTTLVGITGGIGARFGNLSIDSGIIFYHGSVNSFKQSHWTWNTTLRLKTGGK